MAIKKNKIELLDIQFLKTEMENYYNHIESLYDDFYYYDPCDYYCECNDCMPTYTYLSTQKSNLIYRVGRKQMRFVGEPILGKMIDMKSFYPKEVIRQLRIDYLLGTENEFTKPTIGDIFNK
jgi:hypothetical protein